MAFRRSPAKHRVATLATIAASLLRASPTVTAGSAGASGLQSMSDREIRNLMSKPIALPDNSRGGASAERRSRSNPRLILVVCAGQVPTIQGTASGETLNGTPGDDVIQALGGNDTINGGGGADTICGGGGKDKINGDAGLDNLFGEGGDDLIRGGDGVYLAAGDYLGLD
ncbi:MAG: calcium-binding protein, partial [bacterium]